MDRSLAVWINQTEVGALQEHNGVWAFRYTSEWIRDPRSYPLCPGLKLREEPHLDGGTYRPVQWFFDNLLPEEQQRVLIARAANADTEDIFSLLQYLGSESAGSISLLPVGESPPPGELRTLGFEALSRRIKAMPTVALTDQAPKKMSLAGAQHKLAVIYQNGELFEPVGARPSTHILKPNHPEASWTCSVINEWFVMSLAGQVGLNVPAVHRLYLPESVFVIDRFDRVKQGDSWIRQHCIDACQVLGLAKGSKYRAGSLERLGELAALCRPAALARLALFKWLVFNVLVGNEDAHLKNISFLLSADGLQLAPFYDLLSTAAWGTMAYDKNLWPDRATMAWPVLGEDRLEKITAALLLEAAAALGIKQATADSLLRKLVREVYNKSEKLLAHAQEQNAKLLETRPELAPILAGEARMMRVIHHNIVGDMTKRMEASF
jgi:serine/threonine-protein kinase HipA